MILGTLYEDTTVYFMCGTLVLCFKGSIFILSWILLQFQKLKFRLFYKEGDFLSRLYLIILM